MKGDFRDPMASNEARPVASPDGREWRSANISQAFAAPIPVTPPGGKKAFDETTPVKLEVKGADPTRERQIRESITKALTSGGWQVGESPWTLRVTIEVGTSGFELFDKQRTFTPPKVTGFAELLPPGGDEGLATIPFTGEFHREHTAYLVRTKKNDPLEPMTTTYTYDFRGQDAEQAILQECWDKVLKTLESIRTLPTVWEVNGQYQPLPAPVRLQPPPGVPASVDTGVTK
jgi:hypothetical protein